VALPLIELDLWGMDVAVQLSLLQEYAAADRIKEFDFKSAPLMRLALIRLDEDRYHMLWTFHHILFDGWSMPVLMEEFLSAYDLSLVGKALPNVEEDRYEDYIRYIGHKDRDAEEQYWRNYLEGVESGTLLPFIRATAERTKGAENLSRLR